MYKVYKISSISSRKCYIGCTLCSLTKRFNEHKGSTSRLRQLVSAEGLCLDSFSIDLIYTTSDKREAYAKELYFIKLFAPNVYNYTGAFFSEEHRHSMKIAQKGLKKHDAKARLKMSISQRGNTNRRGKKCSAESIKKMSIAHLGIPSVNRGKHKSELFGGRGHVGDFTQGHIPWNKGLKNVQIGSCKGRVSVNNGIIHIRIDKSELDKYIQDGYTRGMLPRKNKKQ